MATPTQAPQPPAQYSPRSQQVSTRSTSQLFGSSAAVRIQGLRIDVSRLWKEALKTLRGQFIALASIILVFSVIAGLLVMRAFSQAYTDLDTIANGSVPSVD